MIASSYKQFFRKIFPPKFVPLVVPVMVSETLYGYVFMCPGCRVRHYVPTGVSDAEGRRWVFNGDLERPTFSPSLRFEVEHEDRKTDVCHLSIVNGMLDYHLDSTHWLGGETVAMKQSYNY
jgi:Family of unknown function (DUF6527)